MSTKNKLIIVDDSPLFRVRLSNFLKQHYSFDIEELNSIREMNDYLNTIDLEDVLLIILDLHLPDGNGLAAIKNYRQVSGSAAIPFIMVSARVNKETVAAAYIEGAKDVVAKPVNYEQLKDRIDRIISPDQAAKETKSIMDYYKQIQMEVKRAQRGNYEVSIVLAGIFQKMDSKSVYKESSKNQVMDLEHKYPEELQKVMRETDAIISLSPSEYLFVLPFTGADGVSMIQEKLIGIFIYTVTSEERDNLLMIIGSATYPGDGDTTDQLISCIEEDFKNQFQSYYKKAKTSSEQGKPQLVQSKQEPPADNISEPDSSGEKTME